MEDPMKNEIKDHDTVRSDNNQEAANPKAVNRREFLGTTVSAAVLGAAVIGGASSAMAQKDFMPILIRSSAGRGF